MAAKQIVLSKIDIKSGKLSYGQRIELGKIFQADANDVEKFNKTFECLHQYTPKVADYKTLIDYFKEIIDGVHFWIEREKLLKYDPTPEETQAGIVSFCEKVGEFATIKSIAKTYGKDPDEIMDWEYGKVFGILYTDMEESKFQKRLNKVFERKYKK